MKTPEESPGDSARASAGDSAVAGEQSRGSAVSVEDIYRWGPLWSRHVGRFLDHIYWNTKVWGVENVPTSGPVLVAANHTGIMDGPVLHGALPRGSHFIVKQEFFDSKLGFLMKGAGQIPVDRTAGRSALKVGKDLLDEGRVVGIFPEGTRGKGDVSSVRAGVAWLALQSGAPILPAAVLGTRRTGDKSAYVPTPRSKLHVVFGPAFHLDVPPDVKGRERMTRVMAQIGQVLAGHVEHAVMLTGVELPQDTGRESREA